MAKSFSSVISQIERVLRENPDEDTHVIEMEVGFLKDIYDALRARPGEFSEGGNFASGQFHKRPSSFEELFRKTRDEFYRDNREKGSRSSWEHVGPRASSGWEQSNPYWDWKTRDRQRPKDSGRSWFEVLEVSMHASKEEIEKSYRRLAMRYHPDRCGPEASEEKMKEINRARDQALGSRS